MSPIRKSTPASARADTVNNKITLDDSGSTVINVDAKNTAFIVNGKPAALGLADRNDGP